MNILYFVLIGLVAGWLAGQLMKGRGFGLVGNLIVGVIGALLGGFLFGLLGMGAGNLLGQLVIATCQVGGVTVVAFEAGNLLGQLVVATVGAVVLLALLGLVKKG